ncbi:hypothetical protein CcaverHIS002_0408770 [Cutaneotrichosporon cavernicola]|uniref:Autophagy-related protein 27 n=1 Tax=Cutaneotrichosporon cavernicola TaxID=279322 RepID=A0AA48L4Y6_9TREE|nr:uncharacterized protein CcaverHIS019_0408710 [Cutaneotrichosporon cavernicola]BEI84273.1 hypothetical protein CcaverHIS002_0408770 [Cutaneotrichosporon cavernicola]BEI92051.1 hypothetical protein CcaverHIS019_0408710 [Cutaneotrichosporon cavernicola]BEI99821.1 hypothetical protein CcaverHIS631_0408640 [Cutaneotrichosporon cavernicola]BEJ07597.1 hypothetical protein CcaverHIS641_0408660 [Cutaneotrichosporon cavernicola]
MRLRSLLPLAFIPLAAAWSCDAIPSTGDLDLSSLGGVKVATKETETPPTKNTARVRIDLCGKLSKEDGVKDEDQCPDGTRACLTLINHKPGASDPDRVTTVIPLWKEDTPDSDVRVTGREGDWTVAIKAPDYAGTPHGLTVTLTCAETESGPTLESYTGGKLELRWSTPAVCANASGGSGGGGGFGFWGFIKFCFWASFFILFAYFALGAVYNHQQYGARGWDLVPHRDFWRELPALSRDFGGHVVGNVRSSTGRGGYSSLG